MYHVLSIKYKFFLGFLLATCYLLHATAPSAHAESISLGVYPPIIQVNATPPANIFSPLTIENRGDLPLSLTISFKPFIPTDREDGQIIYVKEEDARLADPLFFQHIKVLDENNQSIDGLTLSPKQKKNLNLQIDIPRDSPQSDYYFSIIFLSQKTSESSNTSSESVTGIASNVLLSVGSGKVSGEIAEFSVPFFAEKGPVPFTVRVKNTSNHFINPKGEILIKNLFGQTVGRVDLAQVNILANSVRNIPSEDFLDEEKNLPQNLAAYWSQNFILGPYKASLSVALSDTGPLFKRSIFFFAFPVKGLIAIAITVLLLIYIIVRVKSKVKA